MSHTHPAATTGTPRLTERLTPATTGLPAYDALGRTEFEVRTPSGLLFRTSDDLWTARTIAAHATVKDLVVTAVHIAPDGTAAISGPSPYQERITGCSSSFWVFDPDHDYHHIERTLAALAGTMARPWQSVEEAGEAINRQQHYYFNDPDEFWFGVRVACQRPMDGTWPNSHAGNCSFRDWAWNWRTGLPVDAREATT